MSKQYLNAKPIKSLEINRICMGSNRILTNLHKSFVSYITSLLAPTDISWNRLLFSFCNSFDCSLRVQCQLFWFSGNTHPSSWEWHCHCDCCFCCCHCCRPLSLLLLQVQTTWTHLSFVFLRGAFTYFYLYPFEVLPTIRCLIYVAWPIHHDSSMSYLTFLRLWHFLYRL